MALTGKLLVPLLSLCTGTILHADNAALLVGVSHYAIGKTRPHVDLEGPAYDVPALRDSLIRRGFQPDQITELIDSAANRRAILDKLRAMVSQARPGDLLIFYFSGHGTSGFDANNQQLASTIGRDSGALIPYDVNVTSRAQMIGSLIIGRRDLRPILLELNPRAKALVILDACYSQDSSKGIAPRGVPRFLNLRDFLGNGPTPAASLAEIEKEWLAQQAPETPVPDDVSPYSNIVSLAAASRDETAADVGSELIAQGQVHTIDGKPHGAFTNSLLKGLEGEADTDHNGTVTVDELYHFTRDDVRSVFNHTPQILQPADGALASGIAFRETRTTQAASNGARDLLREPLPLLVKLDGVAADFRRKIETVPGITVTNGEYDLLVQQSPGGFDLYHGSRALICHYDGNQRDAFLDRIAAEPKLRQLEDARFPRQDFNVSVDVTVPADQGTYHEGQQLSIAIAASQPGYLLLFDVDSTGSISLLYPASASEAQRVEAGARLRVVNTRVQPPFGTEYLKLLAFQEKPAEYERWMCKPGPSGQPACPQIAPGSADFRTLMSMLARTDRGQAQASLRLITVPAPPPPPAVAASHSQPESRPPATPDSARQIYRKAKAADLAGDYQGALAQFTLAAGGVEDGRLQALILYQQARVNAILRHPAQAKTLAAASLAKLPNIESQMLLADLDRPTGPLLAPAIARSLASQKNLLATEGTNLAVEFELNSDTLTESGRLQTIELGKALSTAELGGTSFLVVGHTDSRGSDAINLPLSERRARTVVEYLVANFGIDARRVRAEGHGSREPVSLGSSEDDYRRNRRVEVVLDRN